MYDPSDIDDSVFLHSNIKKPDQTILLVSTPEEFSDFVSMALFEAGAEGIEIKDAAKIIKDEFSEKYLNYNSIISVLDPSADILSKPTVVLSTVFPKDRIEDIKESVRSYLYDFPTVDLDSIRFNTEDYFEVDWLRQWKKSYTTFSAGHVTIIPKWMKPPMKCGIPVYIDPGMAFGTGQHVSTRLILKLIHKYKFRNKVVLDIGTGSGILGIAAAVQGAKRVYMNDIDPIAVKAAHENAALNNVTDKVIISEADLCMNAKFPIDVVFANLTAELLIRLAGLIKPKMNLCGHIFCSGILVAYKKEVIKAFVKNGFDVKKELDDGEWCGIIFDT
ncbi:MAG: 50S ribosomal protein L11 methyltransferase [Christensenellaceae bacterium]|jgi:ribosomal protein L11 methyltransferase|nr:50S ribosomal protein L11 methyltransferase [Christensenellaceae bacterium]